MSNVISLLVILLSDVSGPVFGSRDYFTSVFFDTYSFVSELEIML